MSETIAAGVLQLTLLATLALAVVMFVRLRRRSRARELAVGKAILIYLGWTLLPVGLLVALFFALIGIEELTGFAPMPEPFARASPLAAGLCIVVAVIATAVFALAARPPRGAGK